MTRQNAVKTSEEQLDVFAVRFDEPADEQNTGQNERVRSSGCPVRQSIPIEKILGTSSTTHVTLAIDSTSVQTTGTFAVGRLLDIIHEQRQLSDVRYDRLAGAIGDMR